LEKTARFLVFGLRVGLYLSLGAQVSSVLAIGLSRRLFLDITQKGTCLSLRHLGVITGMTLGMTFGIGRITHDKKRMDWVIIRLVYFWIHVMGLN